MPELPEVEAARRAVEENCLGKKIKRAVIADDSKVIDGVSPSDFEASLLGKTIVSARRKGKNLWLVLDSPPFPSFQFGMAGAIYIKGVAVTHYKRSAVKDSDEWPSKYSKFLVELDDGLELSFTDKRRFARVRLLDDPSSAPPVSELGPDALLEPMTVDEFEESLKKRKMAIKALLLDQSFVSGIGNWVADEVLYQARIHPLETASSMSGQKCAALHKSIKEVIEKALEVGAESSQFPSNWIFHSREKKPGKAFVDGKKIEFINAGGRTTAYVPELQRLSGKEAATRGSKRKARGKDDAEEFEAEEKDDGPKSKKQSQLNGKAKKPKGKKKTKESHDYETDNGDEADSGGEEHDAKQKKGMKAVGGSKKQPLGKRKAKEAHVDADANGTSDGGDDNDNDDDSDNEEKKPRKQAKTAKTKSAGQKTGKRKTKAK